MTSINIDPTTPETSFIHVLPEVIAQSEELCNRDISAFGTQEYARLRGHGEHGHDNSTGDPTGWLIQNIFAEIHKSRGEDTAYQFMAGSLVVTRSVYVSADRQDVAVERPPVTGLVRPIRDIIHVVGRDSTVDIDDADGRFAVQPALCNMVRRFRFAYSRIGALAMMGLYSRQLMPQDYTLALTIDGSQYTSLVRRPVAPPQAESI